MKKILVLAVAVILMASVVGGSIAWAEVGEDGTGVDASYAGKEIEVAVNGLLIVTLESNPSTGFQWELATNTDEAVLELVGYRFEVSEDALAGACGTGGKEVWTFKALQKGETTITMEYSRPWQGGEKAVKTFVLTVVVK